VKSFRDVNKRVVAVVFLSLLGLATGFAYLVGQQHVFSSGYEVSAVFSDTGGLTAGQDVRVAGVRSGRVTGIHPDFQHGHVIVTMEVDSGIHLGANTHADVELSTLLGGRYVRLSGPVGHPYLDQVSAGRRRIPLERTSVPFTVTDALQSATKLTNTIDPKTINKLLDETAKIKTPTSEKLKEMLANFNTLAGLLNDDAPQIKDLIAKSNQLTGTLAAKDDKLRQIIDASQTLLNALVARRNELRQTLGQGSRLVQTLTTTIDQHQKDLDNLLSSLHLLTTKLSVNMDALNTDLALLGPTFTLVGGVKSPNKNDHWIEGLLTGLGPLQPPGPISSRINSSSSGG